MSVILAILKWIGIVLGGVVGLLLFLTVLLLLVPVRYYIQGTAKGENNFQYGFRLSWLLRIVEVKKRKKSDVIRLHLFGIPVWRFSGEEKKPEKGKQKKTKRESQREGAGEKLPEGGRIEKPVRKKQQKATPFAEKTEKKASGKRKAKKERGKKKKSFSFDKVSSIIDFIRDADNRRAFRKLKREIYQMIRYLAPRRIKGQFLIGTGDPSTTGLLFGGISLLPFVYQEGVHIFPDFEEKTFQADGYMKGRIRVIFLIRLVIRVYRDKELRMLWKNVNQVKKKEAA